MGWRLSFTVPGDCVAQPRHRIGKIIKGRRAGRPVPYLPEEHPVHAFKTDVALKAREAVRDCKGFPGVLSGVPVQMGVLFIMPRGRHPASSWHFQKPDLDNLVKSVKDAMTGIVYEDDSLVCREELLKLYDDSVGLPRLEVVILPVGRATDALASFRESWK
jgi:Holliday junction resolvase RusA-like endonuclease